LLKDGNSSILSVKLSPDVVFILVKSDPGSLQFIMILECCLLSSGCELYHMILTDVKDSCPHMLGTKGNVE